MAIIREQKLIANASTADLLETYNALTGKDIKRFSSRPAAETQVSNAILAAMDAAAHLGVPKGQRVTALTKEERDRVRKNKGLPSAEEQIAAEGRAAMKAMAEAAVKAANKTPARAMRDMLRERAAAAQNKPRPPRVKSSDGPGRKPTIIAVELTGAGRSKMRAQSERHAVFEIVQRLSKRNSVVTVEAIDKALGKSARSHLQKLIFEEHLRAAVRAQKAAA